MDRDIIDFIINNKHIIIAVIFLIYLFFPTKNNAATPKDLYWDIKCSLTTDELLKKCDEAFMKYPNDLSFRYLRAFELFLKNDKKYCRMIVDDYTIVINNYEQYKSTSHNLPALSEIYNDRGFEYFCMAGENENKEFYQRAIDDCDMALRLGVEKTADVYLTIANCKSELGDHNTAITFYTKALESNPSDETRAIIHSNRSSAYETIGEHEAAKADEEISEELFKKIFKK